jgi:hypothetical protein
MVEHGQRDTDANEESSMKPGWFELVYVLALPALVLSSACYPPKSERLTCDDVYDAQDVDFRVLQALVKDEEKGCLDAPCHSAETQRKGLRLDTDDLVYEEFSTRSEQLYEILASGEMPEEGTPWSDEDLKIFRSWYCSGAFPP